VLPEEKEGVEMRADWPLVVACKLTACGLSTRGLFAATINFDLH
jgi:hypothetical protein